LTVVFMKRYRCPYLTREHQWQPHPHLRQHFVSKVVSKEKRHAFGHPVAMSVSTKVWIKLPFARGPL